MEAIPIRPEILSGTEAKQRKRPTRPHPWMRWVARSDLEAGGYWRTDAELKAAFEQLEELGGAPVLHDYEELTPEVVPTTPVRRRKTNGWSKWEIGVAVIAAPIIGLYILSQGDLIGMVAVAVIAALVLALVVF